MAMNAVAHALAVECVHAAHPASDPQGLPAGAARLPHHQPPLAALPHALVHQPPRLGHQVHLQ